MHYHIILTERCNLRCKYCYEKSMDEFDNELDKTWDYDMNTPVDSEVSIGRLKKILKNDDTLIFYGGEPLVMIDKIKEIMDNFNCRFIMQTNGILLDQLPKEYLNRMKKILVSIDGDRERTNFNRGEGKYEIILKNINKAREEGFEGEIVARMTLSFPDIYDQTIHLIELIKKNIFDSIHWQIDAGFYKFDFNFDRFSEFVEEYNYNINKLVDFWIEEMKQKKIVWKIYPFLGIYERIKNKSNYFNNNFILPCGSGHSNFTINTSGKISACPIMNSVKNLYCGSIEEGIKRKIGIDNSACTSCEFYSVCGGRCLYWKEAKLWPKEGDELICKTIKFLIKKIESVYPIIQNMIKDKIINEDFFEYEKYFGPEIIP